MACLSKLVSKSTFGCFNIPFRFRGAGWGGVLRDTGGGGTLAVVGSSRNSIFSNFSSIVTILSPLNAVEVDDEGENE